MKEIIIASVLFLISALAFFMSIRSFCQKGFLFNNAYLYASEKEREIMSKQPYYRQSATVFLLIGLIFLTNGFSVLLHIDWLFYIVIANITITIVYAVVSSIVINKQQ